MIEPGPAISHERDVIGKVVRSVCARWGHEVGEVHYPEDEVPVPDQPVDAIFATSGPRISVEHTLYQSFSNQIEQARWFGPIVALAETISGSLPGPGRYELGVSGGDLEGHHKTDLAALEAWVRTTAPTLTPGRRSSGPTNVAHGGPPELPFPVLLLKTEPWEGRPPGTLDVRWSIRSDELEGDRREEIRRSLRRKLPKLSASRQADGITVLLLENQDMQLVNSDDVARGLRAVLAEEPHLPVPDVIVMAHLIGGSEGLAWLKEFGAWHPHLDDGLYWVAL